MHEALVVALGEAISEVSEEDAKAFFKHCGYREVVQLLLSPLYHEDLEVGEVGAEERSDERDQEPEINTELATQDGREDASPCSPRAPATATGTPRTVA